LFQIHFKSPLPRLTASHRFSSTLRIDSQHQIKRHHDRV
jgi:hypothetical protein